MFPLQQEFCSTKDTGSHCKKNARNTRGRLMFRARYEKQTDLKL